MSDYVQILTHELWKQCVPWIHNAVRQDGHFGSFSERRILYQVFFGLKWCFATMFDRIENLLLPTPEVLRSQAMYPVHFRHTVSNDLLEITADFGLLTGCLLSCR